MEVALWSPLDGMDLHVVFRFGPKPYVPRSKGSRTKERANSKMNVRVRANNRDSLSLVALPRSVIIIPILSYGTDRSTPRIHVSFAFRAN